MGTSAFVSCFPVRGAVFHQRPHCTLVQLKFVEMSILSYHTSKFVQCGIIHSETSPSYGEPKSTCTSYRTHFQIVKLNENEDGWSC